MNKNYITVLMEKIKINDKNYIFKPKKMITVSISDYGFIDENGKEYFPIDSYAMACDMFKEGVYYLYDKNDFLKKYPNFEIIKDDMINQFKNTLLIGTVLDDFKNVQLSGIDLNTYYNMLYQKEIITQNPELYNNFIKEQITIGKEIQENNYDKLFDFIIENLDLILKENDFEKLLADIQKLKNNIVKTKENDKTNNKKYKEREKELKKIFENIIELDDPERYKKIKNVLDKYIIGQEDAKQTVLNSLKMNERKTKETMKIITLLVGPTGCGKTYIAEKLAEISRKPFLNIDATELSLPGLVGTSLEDKLEGLLRTVNFDIKAAENAIVLFDEIDKQSSNKETGLGDNVYSTLLGFLQGKKYTLFKNDKYIKPMEFDTKNMMIISTGSFAKFVNNGLDDAYHRTNIGYNNNKSEVENIEDVKYPNIDGKFLKDSGMPDELVGRVNSIAQVQPMSKDIMKSIIINSEDSALNKAIKLFKNNNVNLKYTDEYVNNVIDEAIKMKTGARSLKFIISKSIKNAEYEILMNPLSISEITLTKDTVKDNKKYNVTYNNIIESNNLDINNFNDINDPYRYKKLRKKLDEYVIGQDDAKKAVIIAIKRGEQVENKNERITTFLVGPTGCGKTFIAETAAKLTNKPLLNIDATELSLPSIVGTSLEDKLESLVESVGYDVKKAENAIVIFDEVDKPSLNKNLNLGESVYHTLLGFLNGKTYTLFKNDLRCSPIEFDTSHLTVISTGSFAKAVKENINDNTDKRTIGFYTNINNDKNNNKGDIIYPEIDTKFLKKSGLPNELVGRIEAVEQLQPMTKEMMKEILINSKNSPLIDFKLLFKSDNVELMYTDDFIEALIDEAMKLKTGARSLRYVVTKTMQKALFDVSMNAYKYDAITLTKDTVKDNIIYEKTKKYNKESNKKLIK